MIESSKIIEFLEKTKSTQANYQFIVLRDLIKSNQNIHDLDLILKSLNEANPKRPKKITFYSTPVFKVLENKKFIVITKVNRRDYMKWYPKIRKNFQLTPKEKRQALKEIKRILKIKADPCSNQYTKN